MSSSWARFAIWATNLILNAPSQFLRESANIVVVNTFANRIPPRPRPLALDADYTTWNGLTNRTYNGRILPADREYTKTLPDLDKVLALFARGDETILDERTTLLFPLFAQWFVDGFLRTNQKDFRLTEAPDHEINLNQLYGTGEAQTNMLRSKTGGKLKSQVFKGEEYPPFLFDSKTLELKPEFEGLYTEANFERVFGSASDETKQYAFAVGLDTGNSAIGPSMMNILFLREHNRVASVIAEAHKDWDDERIFQTTRNCMIAMVMRITVEDYIYAISQIPVVMGPIGFAEKERWYRTNWLSIEFNLLYRWHDLIPDSIEFGATAFDAPAALGNNNALMFDPDMEALLVDAANNQEEFGDPAFDAPALVNNNALIFDLGMETLLVDASNQKAGKLILGNTAQFLMPVQNATLRVSRACGLRSYNEYARYFGMSVPKSFDDLTGDPELSRKLASVYDSVEQVEWYVGLYAAEREVPSMFAPTLMNFMVGYDAVTHIFTNPLLNSAVYSKDTFSKEGFEIMESTNRLHDIVIRNTKITDPATVSLVSDRRD